MNIKIKIVFITIIFLGLFGLAESSLAAPCVDGQNGCLFGWNSAGDSGQNWTGWSWSNNTDSYNSPGWIKNGALDLGGGDWRPRSSIKNDSGSGATAVLDNTTRAPSTSQGSCLKITNPGIQNCPNAYGRCSASWWIENPNNTMFQLGLTNNNTNRLDYYAKYNNAPTGLPNNLSSTVEIGTYLFPDDYVTSGYEIWHFYHQMEVANDVWMHVVLDRHPQHAREGGDNPPVDNPLCANSHSACTGTFATSYYHNFTSLYHDILGATGTTSFWIDEMKFGQTSQPENDISISTVWVAYRASDNHWLLFWDDSSFVSGYNDYTGSTFEIKWSASPITNGNYSSANAITPLYNAGSGCSSCVSRSNNWTVYAYTEFQLPSGTETNNNKLYFAIKDISISGGHKGDYPLNNGDGHNAPNSNIHTIDYNLRPDSGGSDTIAPSAPSGLSVQ